MAFKNGDEKPAGSGIKKGQKQQKTLEWEEFGRELIEAGMPRMLEIIKTADVVQFSINFLQILEYFKPKLSRTEVQNSGQIIVKLESLTDTDLDKLANDNS